MRADPLVRAGLVAVAVAAVLASAPWPLTTALCALAVVAVAESLVRPRGLGAVDAVLVGTGGTLVVLVTLGAALGVSGIGLRPDAWAVALGVIALLALLHRATRGTVRPRRELRIPRRVWPVLPWALVAAAVTIAAVTASERSTLAADVAPVQLSLGAVHGITAQVVVSADLSTPPLELRTQAADGTGVSYPLIRVRPGAPVTTSVTVPEQGRFVITLSNPSQSAPLRTLILER